MNKAPNLLLPLLAAFLLTSLLTAPANAALHLLELSPIPADDSTFSAAENQLQLSFALGLRSPVPVPAPIVAPKISLANPATPTSDFIVGRDTLLALPHHANTYLRPAFDMRDEWNYIRHQVTGPDNLERLATLFDIEEHERPWSTTTTVHLLAPTKGWLLPYASIAHEVDVNENLERFGLGAGVMINLGKNASLGAELLYFSGDRSSTNEAFAKETRFLTRLQIEF